MIDRLRKLDRMAHDREKDGWSFALNELRNLSHLILPMAEALEAERSRGNAYHEPLCASQNCPGCMARIVLRRLGEALG